MIIKPDLQSYEDQVQGGIAQLARALAWHARGQGFDSPCLHKTT